MYIVRSVIGLKTLNNYKNVSKVGRFDDDEVAKRFVELLNSNSNYYSLLQKVKKLFKNMFTHYYEKYLKAFIFY